MRVFLIVAVCCAPTASIHLEAPPVHTLDTHKATRAAQLAAKETAESVASAKQTEIAAMEESHAGMVASLNQKESDKADAEKRLNMYQARYDAISTPEAGQLVIDTKQAIADLGDDVSSLQADVSGSEENLLAARNAKADAESAASASAGEAKAAETEFEHEYEGLAGLLFSTQRDYNTATRDMASSEATWKTFEQDNAAAQEAANADPVEKARLQKEHATKLAARNAANKAFVASQSSAQADIDDLQPVVRYGAATLGEWKGHDVGACFDKAASNKVKFAGSVSKINGAPSGCIRYHNKETEDPNDDEVWFAASCNEDHYNCRTGGCNGCEVL